jgi:hypothetical protein
MAAAQVALTPEEREKVRAQGDSVEARVLGHDVNPFAGETDGVAAIEAFLAEQDGPA